MSVPSALRATLSGVSFGDLSTGATGQYAYLTFGMNDAFAPGTTMKGYTKYTQMYSKCFVIGARFVLRGAVIDNATTEGVLVGRTISTLSTTLTSASNALQ